MEYLRMCVFLPAVELRSPMKHTNTATNITLIRWLMILSQAGLLLFAARWLGSEYQREQERINKELAGCFREAEEEITDSVLKVTLIDPLIREQMDSATMLEIRLGAQQSANWSRKTDTSTSGKRRKLGVVAISASDARAIPDSISSGNYMVVKRSDQAMLRGVKLMIRGLEDSLLIREGSAFYMGNHWMDTSALRERFLQKADKLHPEARFTWVSGSAGLRDSSLAPRLFHYVIILNDRLFSVRLENPYRVISGSMIPALLFTVVVLMLTGISFVVAFRSLKKQLLLNRIRAGMISNITHELKTPVSTVKVALEALNRYDLKQDPALMEEYLGMATREVGRLEMLVNQVLNAAVYEQGKLVLNREPVNLPELIRQVVEDCRPQLDRHNARVQIRIGESFGNMTVGADPLHLQGVLLNLVDNSLKYGGESPEITLELSRSGREIILRYSNNGPAIPEQYLGRIFERFFRVPDGDRHDTKGSGLGLSYASMVMKLHGGSIGARNDPDGGVSFYIRIPVRE